MFYYVESGRPVGEIHHRNVVVCLSEREANDVLQHWLRQTQRFGHRWIYGPHDYAFEDAEEWPFTWDGNDLVPAQVWYDKMPYPEIGV